ncbi:hypothetical protein PoB_002028100 [Plakobranchus ocellatus]|uniref:Uncharacterized protein n=1 Tax=Plakobranchus ocellatus TaxID=259542 RepID=A0AAV3ZGL8_9GAST|nr:hypothetical protein PoB_002028100 [Plakobranchus ocellatus]
MLLSRSITWLLLLKLGPTITVDFIISLFQYLIIFIIIIIIIINIIIVMIIIISVVVVVVILNPSRSWPPSLPHAKDQTLHLSSPIQSDRTKMAPQISKKNVGRYLSWDFNGGDETANQRAARQP